MSVIDSIKANSFIQRVYETPYRLRLYKIARSNFEQKTQNMTDEEVDRIRALKDIHKGERCFVIGMGPSLSREDLLKIKDEICFTANSGYRVLKECGFAPRYYVVTDDGNNVKEEALEVLEDEGDTLVFSNLKKYKSYERFVGLPIDERPITRVNSWLNLISRKMFPTGRFGTDISTKVFAGKTVLCVAIQIAAYMGFDKIYLIGVDMDYTGSNAYSGLVKDRKQNIEHKAAKKTSDNMLAQMEDFAYDAHKKGISIYNATRGGRVDCFERVKLEDIL